MHQAKSTLKKSELICGVVYKIIINITNIYLICNYSIDCENLSIDNLFRNQYKTTFLPRLVMALFGTV